MLSCAFVINDEATKAEHPAVGALNDPALGQRDEALLGLCERLTVSRSAWRVGRLMISTLTPAAASNVFAHVPA
jgi:hypothetical protein